MKSRSVLDTKIEIKGKQEKVCSWELLVGCQYDILFFFLSLLVCLTFSAAQLSRNVCNNALV